MTTILFTVFLGGYHPSGTQAYQGGVACATPTVLSDQGSDTFALLPRAVADPSENLHVVWSGGITERYPDTDAVFYIVYDGKQWSDPVDILASNDGYASVDALVVTPDNHLIVSWVYREPGGSGLRVSRARPDQANSARNWETTPVYTTSVMDSTLFVDDAGRIHLGFIVHEPATGTGHMGYMWSQDNGETWSSPIEFASYDASTVARRFVTLFADGAGSVQMAWAVSTRADDWSPINVEKTVSSDDGNTWSEPEEVFAGPRANMPSFVRGSAPNRVYLTWVRGVDFGDSKYAMMSTDSGLTWSQPKLIISEKRGMNGPMRLAVDSLGTEYLIMAGDQTGVGTRIWISRGADDNSWLDPLPVSDSELHESEFPQALVRHGNELHVFWLDWGQQEVLTTVCNLDAPSTPSLQAQSEVFVPSEPTPTGTPSPAQMVDTANQPPTVPSETNTRNFGAEATVTPSTGSVLAMSALAALLVVGMVAVWQLAKRANTR